MNVNNVILAASRAGDLDYAENLCNLYGLPIPPDLLLARTKEFEEQLENHNSEAAEQARDEGFEAGEEEGIDKADALHGRIADRHYTALRNVEATIKAALHAYARANPRKYSEVDHALLVVGGLIDELGAYDDTRDSLREEARGATK